MIGAMVVIPKRFTRDAVLRQLRGCTARPLTWHFGTNRKPRQPIARLYFVHDGELIGSLPVVDIVEQSEPRLLRRADGSPLVCERKYSICAGGDFAVQANEIRVKSFRGWRYFDGSCPECNGLGVRMVTQSSGATCPACRGSARIDSLEGAA